MKKIPLGKDNFEELVNEGCLYVDKTRYLYSLISEGFYYFLSRPRRFGKSLLLSSLKCIFQGKKDLFKGLAIYDLPWDWTEYPVIHISLNNLKIATAQGWEQALSEIVQQLADTHSVELKSSFLSGRFGELIRGMAAGGPKVVVLIDEYDKPILDNVRNLEECSRIRDVLKGFYGVIKAADSHLKFAMLTGVSKFSKVSVFSDLNNLTDISMLDRYAAMLGYTQGEVESYFGSEIESLADQNGVSKAEMVDKIRKWYNGYCMSERGEKVYNPVSVMSLFQNGRFKNYWFATGTPTFLLELIRERDYPVPEIERIEIGELGLSSFEIETLAIEPLLHQTGYLTIQDYDEELGLYTLSYPNLEVRNAFMQSLAGVFSGVSRELAEAKVIRLFTSLRDNNLDGFFGVLQAFFANIPYDIQLKHEKYYQTIFYLVFSLLGLKVTAESRTNIGRIDAVVELADRVFLFEFKLYDSAEDALEQIRDRGYYEKYLDSGKEIVLVGAAFDADARNVGNWKSELLDS